MRTTLAILLLAIVTAPTCSTTKPISNTGVSGSETPNRVQLYGLDNGTVSSEAE